MTSKSSQLTLDVELPNKSIAKLILERSHKFDHTTFLDADGNQITFSPNIYTGHVQGTKSLVSLTFTDKSVTGVISINGENWNLDIDPTTRKQLIFSDVIVPPTSIETCGYKDLEEDTLIDPSEFDLESLINSGDKNTALSTVDIYLEADHKLFLDFSSDTLEALNYVTSILASVNVIFNDADIDLNFPDIKLWTTMDPYDADNTSSSRVVLDRLKCALDGNYNGRLAHLLSTTNRHGGIAYRRSDCPYVEPLYGFTGIATNFQTDLNVYSYSIHFIAHEIGHNLSSHHTHACRWNGNDTQIDDCGNILSTNNNSDSNCNGIIDDQAEAEGSDCFDIHNPVLPASGTIMSYCHANSGVRVDLSQGFHPQVANRMKNFVDNCLSPVVTVFCPLVDTSEIVITYPTPNSMQLTCTRLTDVDTYAWRYKEDRSCTQSTTVTTTSQVLIIDNLYGNTPYEIQCVLRCTSTQEYGEWSCPKLGHTPACAPVQVVSGSIHNEASLVQAGFNIFSDQQILDNAEVSYYFGREANLTKGFTVDLGSTFVVMMRSCD